LDAVVFFVAFGSQSAHYYRPGDNGSLRQGIFSPMVLQGLASEAESRLYLGAAMVAAAVGTELMLGQTAACPFLLFLVLVSGARFLFNGENTGTPTTRTEKEVMACPHDTC
jgi:hypothetical protein